MTLCIRIFFVEELIGKKERKKEKKNIVEEVLYNKIIKVEIYRNRELNKGKINLVLKMYS